MNDNNHDINSILHVQMKTQEKAFDKKKRNEEEKIMEINLPTPERNSLEIQKEMCNTVIVEPRSIIIERINAFYEKLEYTSEFYTV